MWGGGKEGGGGREKRERERERERERVRVMYTTLPLHSMNLQSAGKARSKGSY